jgi:hypothetical protein
MAREMSGESPPGTKKTVHRIVVTDVYIAELQRLSIAQNKVFKFVYQTWWAWWLPRAIFAGVVVFGLAYHLDWGFTAVFSVLLVISFLGSWSGRRGLAKARDRVRFKGSTTTVTMGENGVDVVGEAGNTHLKWSGLLPPVVYPNGVLLKLSRISYLWLADQALTEGSPEQVRQLLAEHVKDSKAAG